MLRRKIAYFKKLQNKNYRFMQNIKKVFMDKEVGCIKIKIIIFEQNKNLYF